ncbi:MAG: DNA mismatch endonuclease Vsr [Planctomycetota bacterium]|nr:DNA mismatch endonuclease Vsr [Planctomycetota bacterium]
MDVHTPEKRSFNMSRIRSRDSRPEVLLRKLVHSLGFRFRLHRRDLPGTPDLVLPRQGRIIFVHGCFWHMHHCRYGRVKPATRAEFWETKRQGNVTRDRRQIRKLRRLGWRVLVVWECQTRDLEKLRAKLRRFLELSS